MKTTIGSTLPAMNWGDLNKIPENPLDRHWITVEGASFASVLRNYMQEREYTQQDVADLTGVAQPVIGRLLKTAQPSMPTLAKIAQGLGVDISVSPKGVIRLHCPSV